MLPALLLVLLALLLVRHLFESARLLVRHLFESARLLVLHLFEFARLLAIRVVPLATPVALPLVLSEVADDDHSQCLLRATPRAVAR